MRGLNLFWWERVHEDPPGYVRMGRGGPGIAGRRSRCRMGVLNHSRLALYDLRLTAVEPLVPSRLATYGLFVFHPLRSLTRNT